MAGVWDALGAGIERGVAAYLQGREMQAERKRDEEAKARAERDYILAKARGDEEAAYHALQQTNILEQRRLDREAEGRGYTAAQELQELKGKQEVEQIQESGKWATAREKAGKKPEEKLYNPGFNRPAALGYAAAAAGFKDNVDLFLKALKSPQGQGIANDVIPSLVSIYGAAWQNQNLENDYWNFFAELNKNIKRPVAPATPLPAAAKGPGLLSQIGAELGRGPVPQGMLTGGQGAPPTTYTGPETPSPIKQALSTAGGYMGRSPIPEALNPVVSQAVPAAPQIPAALQGGPNPQEQQMINEYNAADFMSKGIFKLIPAYQEVLRKYPNLIR